MLRESLTFFFFFVCPEINNKKSFCCAKTQIRLGLTNDETRLGLGSIVFTYFFFNHCYQTYLFVFAF
jgi:hypothetical protein